MLKTVTGRPHPDAACPAGWGLRLRTSLTLLVLAALLSSCDSGERAKTPSLTGTEVALSTQGRPILARRWNAGSGSPILIFAGIHGDERPAIELGSRLAALWEKDPSRLGAVHVLLLPLLNPDGWAATERKNAQGVDLNRNFPDGWKTSDPGDASHGGTAPLSEPESAFLFMLVKEEKPRRIMSIHSCLTCGGMNNYDGPAEEVASAMSQENHYRFSSEWLVETPGSFGTFAGKTLLIPTVTLELPKDISGEDAWDRNIRAVEAFIRFHSDAPPSPSAP